MINCSLADFNSRIANNFNSYYYGRNKNIIDRSNKDLINNRRGEKFIQVIKDNSLFSSNGLIVSDHPAEFTFCSNIGTFSGAIRLL